MEYNSKQYEIKLNLERIKIIENSIGHSLIGEWFDSKGMMQIATIETVFRFSLHEVGSAVFVPQDTAIVICNDIMKEKGYAFVAVQIQEAMQKDLPFLFQTN